MVDNYSMGRQIGNEPPKRRPATAFELTLSEIQMLSWLAQGKTRGDIVKGCCGRLFSKRYVSNVVGAILQKLEVRNIEDAIKVGLQKGLI